MRRRIYQKKLRSFPMFGYIVINKAEMKFKDYDVYHSYYCGLCKQLKARYGRRGQMTLSYDMTFLILLLDGLYEPDTQKIQARCGAHPLQKHSVHKNEFTDYAAAMNLVLSYYKCKDDWLDERKAKSRLTAGLLHSCALKVNRDYPQKVSFISSRLSRIRALELEEESSLDTMAGLFGEIMGKSSYIETTSGQNLSVALDFSWENSYTLWTLMKILRKT